MLVKKIYSFWFLVPVVAIYSLFFILPVVVGAGYSFTNWNSMLDTPGFVGFQNYIEILSTSGQYFKSLLITLVFTGVTVVIKSACGLGLAVLLNNRIMGKNALRGIFFLPNTLSPLIIGILFVSILAPSGLLNSVLNFAGLEKIATNWLTNPETVLGATIGVETWRMVGWNMVMFMAGLQVIPKDYYEASSIDGASVLTQFTKITLPLLKPVLMITIVLNTIHGIKVFDLVFALTGGGPGRLTEVLNISVFREFSIGRYGMSTALGIVVFAIAVIFAMLIKNTMTRQED